MYIVLCFFFLSKREWETQIAIACGSSAGHARLDPYLWVHEQQRNQLFVPWLQECHQQECRSKIASLVGGLEHFLFSHILGISSSQLTNSYFSEGWLNHQPEVSWISCGYHHQLDTIPEWLVYGIWTKPGDHQARQRTAGQFMNPTVDGRKITSW